MLGLTATLLAALLDAPAPGTLDPTTGAPQDIQPRATPPTVEPRPSPGVNFGQSPTSVTPPATRPPSPAGPSAPRTPLMRPRPEAGPTPPPGTGPSEQVQPTTPAPEPSTLYPLSFAAEELSLSEVLKSALEGNIDLRNSAIDIAITEKQVTAALGAYDVFFLAGTTASKAVTPQRGSAAAFTVGNQSLSGNFGFERKLESGGTINFTVTATRSTILQPINFFNAAAGTRQLNSYIISPSLTLTHPLLRNAGVRVNRADIDRARIARTQMEANQLQMAQTAIHDIILAYWDVLFASRDLENKRRSAATTSEQHRRVKAEVAAGRKSQLDLDTIYQSLVARENEVVLAENTLLDRSLTLRQFMGQDFSKRKVLGVLPQTDPQALAPREIDLEAEIKKAYAANPQLRSLEIGIASRRIDELVAANARLPILDFRFQFTPQGRSVDLNAVAETGVPAQRASWPQAFSNFFTATDVAKVNFNTGPFADFNISGSLNFNFDIQGRTPKANHERVVLEIRKAEFNLQKSQQQISIAVIRSVNAMRTASARLTITSEAVRLAESNLRAEEARFRVGRSTSYDVLFRQDELALAQFNALSAQIDFLRATVELQTLTGQLLPSYGLELSGAAAPRQASTPTGGSYR
ncbi:TolC family protein [Nannocystis sp. SCPEA4]|uniref:TolC family protein n=1 Tax=Nannocystis sp. SCPEA4 TaxID=2996787 RepID=UPI00226FF3D7|nr:TolC family protein [Nannocystis sp. SCPEA4]